MSYDVYTVNKFDNNNNNISLQSIITIISNLNFYNHISPNISYCISSSVKIGFTLRLRFLFYTSANLSINIFAINCLKSNIMYQKTVFTVVFETIYTMRLL